MPQVDMSQIPAATQQAIAAQQGATNQDEMTKVLEMLSNDPAAMAAVLQQIGLPIDEQQLMQVAENWVDNAASTQASLPPDGEEADTPAAYEDEDVEADDEEDTKPPDTSVPVEDAAAETQEAAMPVPPNGSSPMARSNNPIDDLISAQMMQSAVGNPNAPVPTGMQAGRQQRPAIPASRQPASGNNARQQMIADIFRKQGGGKQPKKKANG